MNALGLLGSTTYYMEIGLDALRGTGPQGGITLDLERLPNGRLTTHCKEQLAPILQEFLKRKNWQPRPRVFCAISAGGVTLRRLSLPASGKDNLERLLLFQIESEFPLPPEELAWGYQALRNPNSRANGPGSKQDYLVVAVRKEVIEDYSDLLSRCGGSPLFTLAALARSKLCPGTAETCVMLDVGSKRSEWASFADGVVTAIRILPWGKDEILQDAGLDFSAAGPNGKWQGEKLYLSAAGDNAPALAPRLRARLGEGSSFQTLDSGGGLGNSSAILGLRKAEEQNAALPVLGLKMKPVEGTARIPVSLNWKSARVPLLLLLALLLLPFVEAFLLKPFLARKLTRLKADQVRLATIDQELGFLQYLKQNQSPYLDAIYLLSKVAPPGAHIDFLSMNRRGELTLRISMREPTQVVDFRSKLVDSGFFSNVAIEEQAPSPDRQKLNLRLSAQWKAGTSRQSISPTAQEIEQARNAKSPGPMMGGPSFPMGGPTFAPPPTEAMPPEPPPPGAVSGPRPIPKPTTSRNRGGPQ